MLKNENILTEQIGINVDFKLLGLKFDNFIAKIKTSSNLKFEFKSLHLIDIYLHYNDLVAIFPC